jgi:hypothetical protein
MAQYKLVYLTGALLLASAVLRADTVYSNFGAGANGTGGGYLLGGGIFPPFSGFFALGIAFTPTANYTLDTIRIPITSYSSAPQNQFIFEICSGVTQPTTVLERYTRFLSGFSVVELDSSLHPVLYAGQQYWAVVSTVANGVWGWGDVVHPAGTVEYLQRENGPWITFQGALLPGLFVAGTPTTVRAPTTLFQNGGSVPHFVAGGGWQTTFAMVNTGTTSATAGLSFFDDSGSPLSVPLIYAGNSLNASSISEQIAGGASIIITAADGGPLQQGYATFTTTGEVGALTTFRYNPNGQEIGVPLETRNANSYLVAFDHTGGVTTCIAVANLSGFAASVPVAIRDQSGALIQTAALSLPGNGHTSFSLTDMYTITKGQRGVIEFDVPDFGSLSVFALRTAPISATGGFSLATIPVIAR